MVAAGRGDTIDDDHALWPIGKDRVLDWESDGRARVWRYAPVFDAWHPNPLSGPVASGRHPTLGDASVSVLELADDHLLSWNEAGDYWVWKLGSGADDPMKLVRHD